MILNVFGVCPFYGNEFEQKFFSVTRSLNRDLLRSFQLTDMQLQRLEDEDLDKRQIETLYVECFSKSKALHYISCLQKKIQIFLRIKYILLW